MRTLIYTVIIFLFFSKLALSFQSSSDGKDVGTGGRDDLSYLNAKNSNFKKGKDALKQALKYQKKNKLKKANKRYEKALEYFVLAYDNYPNNIEILNYLGFTYNAVGDVLMSEIYYRQALLIEPKNPLTNQKLGELYLNTNKNTLAEERLKILSTCDCREYLILKEAFENN